MTLIWDLKIPIISSNFLFCPIFSKNIIFSVIKGKQHGLGNKEHIFTFYCLKAESDYFTLFVFAICLAFHSRLCQ